MNTRGFPLRRENEALRARFTALGEASLRIGASLDLETVLQEVVDSARALTVARAAFIATMDDTGAPEDFFASGITEEAFRSLLEWPDGPRVFEHVRALDEPLRVEDFSAFLRGLGEIIRAEQPALMLLDLVLPGTDGIELMRKVPELADLPVVFISGYGRDETVARALEAGAEDYIVKPFSPTELVARVRAPAGCPNPKP